MNPIALSILFVVAGHLIYVQRHLIYVLVPFESNHISTAIVRTKIPVQKSIFQSLQKSSFQSIKP